MEQFGKTLVFVGLALVVIGGLMVWVGPKGSAGGFLPGDIAIKRGNASFYFPVVTCLVLSGLLTLLFRLFNR